MARIFLNYCFDESKRAREIGIGLKQKGHQILALKPGQNWRSNLIPLLHKCDLVVVLLTRLSVKHDWTILEWSIAYTLYLTRQQPGLLPVRPEEVKYPDPLNELGRRIDAFKDNPDNTQVVNEFTSIINEHSTGPKIFLSNSLAISAYACFIENEFKTLSGRNFKICLLNRLLPELVYL